MPAEGSQQSHTFVSARRPSRVAESRHRAAAALRAHSRATRASPARPAPGCRLGAQTQNA
eukprot:7767149-Heterocapsa_arctica.AAC.1